MYGTEIFPTKRHAALAVVQHRKGARTLTPQQFHVASAMLSGVEESELGSLKSVFKKIVKVANKLDPLYSVRKKIDPVTKAVDKAVGLAPKAVAKVADAPATQVLPEAPPQPIPALPTPFQPSDAQQFAQGSSSGGGGGAPAPVPGDAAPADTWLTTPVMIGMGVAGLLVLYLLLKKRR